MEHLTLPSVGPSFKNGGLVHPLSQTSKKNSKKIQKNGSEPDRPGVDPRSLAARELTPGMSASIPFKFYFIFLLPSTFCACGQLLLVGFSTCLPCPDLSKKLQTSITFNP
jgi:hypothetical protein